MDIDNKIRKAQKSDSDIVPEIMLQAMGNIIYHFIQKENRKEAIHFLTQLFKQKGNLYSYENTFVAIDDNGHITGSLTGYDGDQFIELRQPILDHIKEHYNNKSIPEAETVGDEFYIDSVAVAPIARGKGIGTALLRHAITYAKRSGFKKVGLLVDLGNPNAQKLYERMGFNLGEKTPFAGGEYYHMNIQLD